MITKENFSCLQLSTYRINLRHKTCAYQRLTLAEQLEQTLTPRDEGVILERCLTETFSRVTNLNRHKLELKPHLAQETKEPPVSCRDADLRTSEF